MTCNYLLRLAAAMKIGKAYIQATTTRKLASLLSTPLLMVITRYYSRVQLKNLSVVGA